MFHDTPNAQPKMDKTDKTDKTDKMEQIVQAAAECFQAKGYQATALRDIAEAVKLQKPTLYHYVRNKNELLFLVLINTAESYNRVLEAIVESSLAPSAKLAQAVRQQILLQFEHPGTVTLFRDLAYLDEPHRNEVRLVMKRYRDLLEVIILEGIRVEEFQPCDTSLAVLLVLGAVNFVHRWYRPGGPKSLEAITEYYSQALLGALRHTSTPVPPDVMGGKRAGRKLPAKTPVIK